jgi:hypothetical protein
VSLQWALEPEQTKKSLANTSKRPEEFLNNHVVRPESKAESKLKLWLSAASSNYMLKLKGLRRPKIWMLTGLYILEDVKISHAGTKRTQSSLGIDATTMAAATSVPLGASVKIHPEDSIKVELTTKDRLIWAAQYHMLEARYIRVKSGEKNPEPPSTFPLYPDVLSTGYGVRGDAKVSFGHVSIKGGPENDTSEGDEPEESRAYGNDLGEAIADLEDWVRTQRRA